MNKIKTTSKCHVGLYQACQFTRGELINNNNLYST